MLNTDNMRFMPKVELKNGDVTADDIGAADWKGNVANFDSVAIMFGFSKRVDKSEYPSKVTVVVTQKG